MIKPDRQGERRRKTLQAEGYVHETIAPIAENTASGSYLPLLTYDVITPPAARSIFDAVWTDCAGRWVVDYIDVLQPVQKIWSLVETKTGATRRCHCLIDVAYALTARLRVDTDDERARKEAQLRSFRQLVADRAFSRPPFLGLVDFPATVSLASHPGSTGDPFPSGIRASGDLGWVLFDTQGVGRTKARFFQASMIAGRVAVGALADDQLAS